MASLNGRVARLEAAHGIGAPTVTGVITYENGIPDSDVLRIYERDIAATASLLLHRALDTGAFASGEPGAQFSPDTAEEAAWCCLQAYADQHGANMATEADVRHWLEEFDGELHGGRRVTYGEH